MNGKSTFGLSENIASLCCYAGVFVTGLVFLVCERENKTVRFHAMQSLIWFAALFVVSGVIGIVPILGGLAQKVLGLVLFASWLFLMYMAYKGTEFRIPVLGDAVHETVNK